MSRHKAYTASGMAARLFEWAVKSGPKEMKLPMAASYGIVELLGFGTFASAVLWPTLKAAVKSTIVGRLTRNARK